MDKFLGKRLDGRYEIQEIIGIGGMAVVYKAFDSIEGKTVAIKILKEEFGGNNEFLRRFKNESKAVSVLNHPNIVKIHDVSFGDNFQYIVMEYIDGITLKEYISRQGILSWKETVFFTIQILHALQHAHDKGIVHRDIKPQNILMLRDGTIKVTDFGIARFSRSDEHTITDKAIGSVHYISPEQASGGIIDEKADLYSVGVLMYEMLTGSLPFQADSAVSVAIMQMQNDARPPREINPSIPVGLEQITMRAMRKNPVKRYLSDAEMLRDIEEFKRNPDVDFHYNLTDAAVAVDDSPTRYVDSRAVAAAASSTAAAKIDGLYGTAPKAPIDEFDSITSDNIYEDEYYDEEEHRSRFIPALVAIAVAVGLIVASFGIFILVKAFGDKTGNTSCPAVVGLNYLEAKEMFKDDVELVVKEWRFDSSSEYGQILEQQFDAGKPLKKGSQVNIIVSKGIQKFNVPNVYGEFSADAKQKLENVVPNIQIEIVNETSETVAKDKVIKTDPARGALVTSDTVITVYVSSGKPTVYTTVPSLLNFDIEYAKELLERSRLKVGSIVEQDVGTNIKKGVVLNQSIKPNESVGEFTSVDIIISSGKEPTNYNFSITVPRPAELGDTAYSVKAVLTNSGGSTTLPEQSSSVQQIKFDFTTTSKLCTVSIYIVDGQNGEQLYQEYSVNEGRVSTPTTHTLTNGSTGGDSNG